MNNRLCWGLSKKTKQKQPLSPDTFSSHLQMYKLFLCQRQVLMQCFFSAFKKGVEIVFSNLCGVNQNASVCLFSPPRPQSAISPFDLLFIWLSPCTSRLFILHFNIWWGHLWSGERGSWVTSVDKNVFLSALPLIIFQISAVFFKCYILYILNG